MPYIPQKDRMRLNPKLEPLISEMYEQELTPGELNFVLTRIIRSHIRVPTYLKINEVMGVLECAKMELYRRMAAEYEDAKLAQHGDVY